MTELELDEQTHQRVLEFIATRNAANAPAAVERGFARHSLEIEFPGTIAQQTAADLMQFLQRE